MDQEQRTAASFKTSKAVNTLATVLAAAYAWQLHGFLIGIAIILFLTIARGWTANVITMRYLDRLNTQDKDPDLHKLLRLTMASRWLWVVVTFVALALSAAQVCTGVQCKSIWS